MNESASRTPVIVDGIRTPFGRYGGALKDVRPDDMAAHVIRTLVARSSLDPTVIDDVILGAANQAGEDNRNVGRMGALLADLPVEVPGQTVNRLCGSGSAGGHHRRACHRLRRRVGVRGRWRRVHDPRPVRDGQAIGCISAR